VGASAETLQTDAMKPRSAVYVDNKLKQRIVQVCVSPGRLCRGSRRYLRHRLSFFGALLLLQIAFRLGSVGIATPPRVTPGLPSLPREWTWPLGDFLQTPAFYQPRRVKKNCALEART
jgi:hypothetical protein